MTTKTSRGFAGRTCALLAALFTSFSLAHADIVFDSFTPPSTFGGFSSPDSGLATQVFVASDLTITGMAVWNEMLSAGLLRFCILDFTSHAFLLLTDPLSFATDPAGPTWKDSEPFSFTLVGGHRYLLGYLHDVAVNDYGDFTGESQNGVTSELEIHTLDDFSNPSYGFNFFSGADSPFRLYAVPEPSSAILFLLPCAWFVAWRSNGRRREIDRSSVGARRR